MWLEPQALLNAKAIYEADRLAAAAGAPTRTLMENAGRAVAVAAMRLYSPRPTLVLCGGGHNGGDGYVAARHLKQAGWQVTAAECALSSSPSHDASAARRAWEESGGATLSFFSALLADYALCIDALLGVGLSRPVEGEFRAIIEQVNASDMPVLAVDIPSGVNADTGEIMGAAIRAAHTVTFFCAKPGHYLLPGKAHGGTLEVADIGIPASVLAQVQPDLFLNAPALWLDRLPLPSPESHKYTRGHAVVCGGPAASTGAARLAAISALRAGAGLVSVACDGEALPVYAAALAAVMTRRCDSLAALQALVESTKVTALLIGPGGGTDKAMRERVRMLLALKKPCVLDADVFTAFADDPPALLQALHGQCVLTPHMGEYARIFTHHGSKLDLAKAAAKQTGAVILLKGSDTVVAAPDGQTVINANAPPWLATAGSGDVLAGLISGLLAQGMAPFDAACAGAWLHGEAARRFGPGLIAEDMPHAIPPLLSSLYYAKGVR